MNFFLNDNVHNDIYTYRHPLSRTDALPISCTTSPRISAANTAEPATRTPGSRSASVSERRAAHCEQTVTLPEARTAAKSSDRGVRSEEQTSELQSLMRI